MLDVPIRLGSTSFQSKDVNGAQKSLFLFYVRSEKRDNQLRAQNPRKPRRLTLFRRHSNRVSVSVARQTRR